MNRKDRLTDKNRNMPVEISDQQLAEFRDVFKKFDENNDNTISVSELRNVFDALSIDITDEELKTIVRFKINSLYLIYIINNFSS